VVYLNTCTYKDCTIKIFSHCNDSTTMNINKGFLLIELMVATASLVAFTYALARCVERIVHYHRAARNLECAILTCVQEMDAAIDGVYYETITRPSDVLLQHSAPSKSTPQHNIIRSFEKKTMPGSNNDITKITCTVTPLNQNHGDELHVAMQSVAIHNNDKK
jgi:hypothetical protein